jgi:hypothetical protein
MSPIAALRNSRSSRSSALQDLPPATTDEELLAWSDGLVHQHPAPPARRRGEKLHAERRVWVDGNRMSTDELLDEIERRATKAAKPKLILRRA